MLVALTTRRLMRLDVLDVLSYKYMRPIRRFDNLFHDHR